MNSSLMGQKMHDPACNWLSYSHTETQTSTQLGICKSSIFVSSVIFICQNTHTFIFLIISLTHKCCSCFWFFPLWYFLALICIVHKEKKNFSCHKDLPSLALIIVCVCVYIYIYIYIGVVLSVIGIITENGIGTLSSNLRWVCLHFSSF